MATVKDVARLAGVSLGTVSNVLNGKKNVKQATRDKVYQVMGELEFQYNMTASSLRTKTTKNIGLVIPTIVNPYYPELSRGVEDVLIEENFTLFLCNSDRDKEKEMQYIRALLSKGADGIILVKSKLDEKELENIASRTKLVLVDYDSEKNIPYCCINVDDNKGIIQGMELLEQYGHERIAFITGLKDAYSSICRIKSYENCLRKRNISFREEYMVEGKFSWISGYEAARQLLSLPEPPTAIFAANDIMAMGAIRAVLDSGRCVPQDISVLGYDDIEMGNMCMPSLTTIHQPKYRVGAEAAKLLLYELNKGNDFKTNILVETRVIIRESVGKVFLNI